jgi:hypothetical protein
MSNTLRANRCKSTPAISPSKSLSWVRITSGRGKNSVILTKLSEDGVHGQQLSSRVAIGSQRARGRSFAFLLLPSPNGLLMLNYE